MSFFKTVRYSLAAIILIVTFAGLVIGAWSANHRLRHANVENARLRYELSELRRETGYLEVTDPQQLHAVALPSLEDLTWQWRIYVPNITDFDLNWGFDGIAGEGIDARYTKRGASLSEGMQTLTCAIRRDLKDPELGWLLICQSSLNQAKMTVSLPRECQPWFTEQQGVAFAVSGIGMEPEAASTSEPFILRRQRRIEFSEDVHQVKREDSAIHREGLLIWITPRQRR